VSGFYSTDTKAGRLRTWAKAAIERHRAEGTIPTSLRHLYYEAVMDSACPDVGKAKKAGGGRRPDQDLTDAVTDLREAGEIDWDEIEDRTRHLIHNQGFTTYTNGVEAYLDQIHVDPYNEHPLPVLVVESESVAGVLERIADEYRVPIVPTRGQTAGFLRTTVADFLGYRKIVVGYIGDADKAGGDIENNSADVLTDVSGVVSWERLALTWAQVDDLGLPTEARFDKRTRRTTLACEVEAYPQVRLEADVTAFLDGLLPEPLEDVQEREAAERARVRGLLS
jgi:hypothetical protein